MSTPVSLVRLRRCPGQMREGAPRRPALPPVLDVLFEKLAADTTPAGRQPVDGLVGFKNAGYLVTVLADAFDRLVTRRALLRYLSALRRRLDQEPSRCGFVIQSNRWFGWRVVPRAAMCRAKVYAGRA